MKLPLRPLMLPLLTSGLLLAVAVLAHEGTGLPNWSISVTAVLCFALQIATMSSLRRRIFAAFNRKPK